MAALVGCVGGGDRFAAAAVWKHPRARSSHHAFGHDPFGRYSCRFPGTTGPFVEHSLGNRRSVEVRVTADFSDSKPDSSNKRRGKFGYHPLEELSKVEKEEIDQAGDGKLTDAEVARTVAEVNWSAVVFSSVISDEDAVFGTEVQYLIDDQGDFYFEVEDDNEFLRNLSSEQVYTVLIGYGNVDNLHFSELIEGALVGEDEDDDDSGDEPIELDSEDIEILWEAVEDIESMIEDSTPEDSFSSLGGWGGFKTLDEVHPMEFAYKVSEAVSADHASDLGKPARRLTITGVARPVTEDEEPYVQGIWYDRFLMANDDSDNDEEESDEEDDDGEEGGDEGHNDDGDIVGSTNTQSARSGRQDGGKNNRIKAGGIEGAHNGVMFGKPLHGTAKLSNPGDLRKRIDPLVLAENVWQNTVTDGAERSINDGPLLEVGNSAGNPAENLGALKDINREGHESQEGAIISWESSVNNDKSKQLGAVFEVPEGLDDTEVEYSTEIVLPPGTSIEGDAIVVDWSEKPKPSFYKLEILSIRLDCGTGGQSNIEVRDFAFAEPDVLAHFSTTIMEKINAGGSKIETALKALVQRCKGLEAEEISLVGIDCLGVDLRVQFGIEVQTIRVPFSRRATCEESAEKLLDQLLFPRPGQRRPRKRGQ